MDIWKEVDFGNFLGNHTNGIFYEKAKICLIGGKIHFAVTFYLCDYGQAAV